MDVVVTVPKSFGLDHWISEGDPAGAYRWWDYIDEYPFPDWQIP